MSVLYNFESSECAEFPTYIMFDITNVCNSKCIHCPHSVLYSLSNTRHAFLEFELFKKAIDECAGRYLQFVRITADGEPLLHRNLFKMIAYAAEKKVGPLGLTTNGSLMNADIAEKILESGLFMIDFSLDAMKEETYKIVRKGLSFKKVINNIMRILDLRTKRNSPLKIMVSFVKQKENINDLEDFKMFWEPLVDKVLIRELISNINLVDISQSKENSEAERWPCPHWFRRVVINYDGMIKACPVDWENKTVYKHLSETTIYDAWHSDFYCKNRMEHLNNQFAESSPCKDCNDWQGSPWNLGYEKVVGVL